MKLSHLVAAAAASCMAVAPIAAQAGTRAAGSAATYAADSNSDGGNALLAEGGRQGVSRRVLMWLLLGGVGGAGLIVALSKNKSNGAN